MRWPVKPAPRLLALPINLTGRHGAGDERGAGQDLPPSLLHSERNFLRSLPCRPFWFAWSEHCFDTAFLSVLLVAADALAAGVSGFGVCASVWTAAEPSRRTIAGNAKICDGFIVTSGLVLQAL